MPQYTKFFPCHIGLKGIACGAGAHTPALPHTVGKECHCAASKIFVPRVRCLISSSGCGKDADSLPLSNGRSNRGIWPRSWTPSPGRCTAKSPCAGTRTLPQGFLPSPPDGGRTIHGGRYRVQVWLANIYINAIACFHSNCDASERKRQKSQGQQETCREAKALQWHISELPCAILKWQKTQLWQTSVLQWWYYDFCNCPSRSWFCYLFCLVWGFLMVTFYSSC